eukprot:TRINITY_DN36137_c0_g1_i1.p1 TRINITY_DN36137_c0_g1~~TRINITY_DN36137_c0_g1_i1.p1  ORF type:complete len:107 (-),score=18.76 TRINITY_DN36137_c0_g1_i1:72-392(-)
MRCSKAKARKTGTRECPEQQKTASGSMVKTDKIGTQARCERKKTASTLVRLTCVETRHRPAAALFTLSKSKRDELVHCSADQRQLFSLAACRSVNPSLPGTETCKE